MYITGKSSVKYEENWRPLAYASTKCYHRFSSSLRYTDVLYKAGCKWDTEIQEDVWKVTVFSTFKWIASLSTVCFQTGGSLIKCIYYAWKDSHDTLLRKLNQYGVNKKSSQRVCKCMWRRVYLKDPFKALFCFQSTLTATSCSWIAWYK